MSRLFTACIFVLASGGPALATWSVIALDPKTGTVAVASATCVAQRDVAGLRAKGLMDIQAIIVPGKGAAVAQAEFDGSRASQRLIYAALQKGTDPETIVFMLSDDIKPTENADPVKTLRMRYGEWKRNRPD